MVLGNTSSARMVGLVQFDTKEFSASLAIVQRFYIPQKQLDRDGDLSCADDKPV